MASRAAITTDEKRPSLAPSLALKPLAYGFAVPCCSLESDSSRLAAVDIPETEYEARRMMRGPAQRPERASPGERSLSSLLFRTACFTITAVIARRFHQS